MKGLKRFIYFILVLAVAFVLPSVCSPKAIEAKTKKVRLNYSWIKLSQGGTMNLKVMGASNKAFKKVKWKSSNKKIARVNKKGKVTAKKAGKCTVTLKIKNKKLKCQVRVKKKEVVNTKEFTQTTLNVLELKMDLHGITYDAEEKAILSDEPGTFKLQLLNSSKTPKWMSSDVSIATVNNGMITAVAEGNCTISAVIANVSYKCNVTITNLRDADKITVQKNVYEVLGYLNISRVKAKVQPLKIKEELNAIADLRVNEVVTKNKFSHTRPDGTNYKTAYNDIGFAAGGLVGEILANLEDKVPYMDQFAKVSYNRFYDYLSNRQIMENPRYEYIGISYKNISAERDYWGTLYFNTYWVLELYA